MNPAAMGMSTTGMPPLSLSDETKQDLRTEVEVGGFTGGNFSVNRSFLDGLNSENQTTQLITGAVLLGGVFIAGITALKLLKGRG